MSKSTAVVDSMPVGPSVERSTAPEVVQFPENFDAAIPMLRFLDAH